VLKWNDLRKHVFLHVTIATWDAVIGRHNSLAQKLEAEIVKIVSVHCHMHRFASACCYISADLYSARKCESTLMQLWKCFTVSPMRSACLARHQATMKTKGRQLQRACKTRSCRVRQMCRDRSEILVIWAALKQLWACAIRWGTRGTRPPLLQTLGTRPPLLQTCHVPPQFSL